MNILMLSIDEHIFEEGSRVSNRIKSYGKIFSELHIVIHTKKYIHTKKLAPNVYIYPTNTNNFRYLWNGYGICKKILKKNKCDIVTSQDAFTNILALLLKIQFSFKFQVQVHTDFLSPYFKKESFKNKLRYYLYKISIRRADCVRVVSESTKNILVNELKVKANKIFVLPVFTKYYDTNDFIKRDGYNVLMLSRLTQEKRVDIGIKVFKLLFKKYPHATLTIVGDGPEKERLEKLAQGHKKINFAKWTNNPIEYYEKADVFLVTSAYEGYGLTIAEALSTGLPVVSTDVGIAKDFGAIISEAGTPEDIYRQLSLVFEKRPSNSKKITYINSIDDYLPKLKKSFEMCL